MLRSLKSILFIFMVLFIVVNLRRNRMAPMSEISNIVTLNEADSFVNDLKEEIVNHPS